MDDVANKNYIVVQNIIGTVIAIELNDNNLTGNTSHDVFTGNTSPDVRYFLNSKAEELGFPVGCGWAVPHALVEASSVEEAQEKGTLEIAQKQGLLQQAGMIDRPDPDGLIDLDGFVDDGKAGSTKKFSSIAGLAEEFGIVDEVRRIENTTKLGLASKGFNSHESLSFTDKELKKIHQNQSPQRKL